MERKTVLVVASVVAWLLTAGTVLLPAEASGQSFSPDRVAVIRCETDPNGTIAVRSSSVTSAAGVSVQQGDRCAATISALQQAGMRMVGGPQVTRNPFDSEVSFSFVFIVGYYDDDYDDDDD